MAAKLLLLLVGVASLFLPGCILSMQPLYRDADVVFEPALVGTWKPVDEDETWQCSADDRRAYRVIYIDEKRREGRFSVHLVAFAGERFLDLFPLALPDSMSSLAADHWLPAHTFARVVHVDDKSLQLAFLDEEWLKKLLAKEPRALRHEVANGDIVLTADTAELQHFLSSHVKTNGAFRPMLELRRVAAG